MRTATTKSRTNAPRRKKQARSSGAGRVPPRIRRGRRGRLLRPKGKPSNEKEESSGEAGEGFTQTWEAVSRRPRQDRGLGRAHVRGRDDVRTRALHGQD